MIAFNVQAIKGFDAPPRKPVRGLIGVGEEVRQVAHDYIGQIGAPAPASAFDILVAHQQSRPTFEHAESRRQMHIAIGTASEYFGGAAFAYAIVDQEPN